MTTTWGVGVGEGDGDGDGEALGDTKAEGCAGVPAWAAHAVKAKARTGAIVRMREARIVAGGFYERGPRESIRRLLTFPDSADLCDGAKFLRDRPLRSP